MPIRVPVTQYPIPIGGSKKMEIVDLKGLASYAAETLDCNQFEKGLGFEAIIPLNVGVVAMPTSEGAGETVSVPVALSLSGTYFVTVRFATTLKPGDAAQSVTVRWYVTATGAECGAIDLSAETARVLMIFG